MEEKNFEEYAGDEVDEFFGDGEGEEGNESSTMADRELAALRERLTTLGYQDGVDDGVQDSVQQGFDKGFEAGAAAGWETGLLYGATAATEAALAVWHTRSADAAGTTSSVDTAADSVARDGNPKPNIASEGSSARSRGGGEAGKKDESAAAAVAPSAAPIIDTHKDELLESDGKDTGRRLGDLQQLVEDLKRASLMGPDVPRPSDRSEVLQRLRLVGPAGAAAADSLDL